MELTIVLVNSKKLEQFCRKDKIFSPSEPHSSELQKQRKPKWLKEARAFYMQTYVNAVLHFEGQQLFQLLQIWRSRVDAVENVEIVRKLSSNWRRLSQRIKVKFARLSFKLSTKKRFG